MPLHLTFWELQRTWAFSCLCYAWISSITSLPPAKQALWPCYWGSREPAPLRTLSDAHGVTLTGRQCWLPGPGTPSPCGVNAWSSWSSSNFSCVSRNVKVKKLYRKKFKAVPDVSLPVRFKLEKPGSKLCPDLVLLVQTLQLCFCWTDLLPFPPSHFSISLVLLSLPTMEKIPTCRY